MGALALGVLWSGTVLVLLASAGDVRRWFGLWRRMRLLPKDAVGVGMVAARIEDGSGPLARHSVIQTGRWAAVSEGDPRAIIFHDREYRSELLGGRVRTLDGSRQVDVPGTTDAEVWAPGKPQVIDPDLGFEQAYVRSKHVRGFPRVLRTELVPNGEVWLVGELCADGTGWTMTPPMESRLIVSTVDPRTLSAAKIRLGLTVMFGAFLVAAGSTALAVWPPAFGGRSIAGAVLCLAFFLLVQPVGVWLREALRSPASAIVRGTMVEKASEAAAKTEAPSPDLSPTRER
jgi:hypothetical protein